MDGRVQLPVNKYIMDKYAVKYVDMITVAGADGTIAENQDESILINIHKRIHISLNKHGSKVIVIVGHADCAGYPVSDEKHFESIKKSAAEMHEKYPDVIVEGIWLDEKFTDVEMICGYEVKG